MYSESGSISNGAGEFLFAGQTAQPSLRRALIQFDVASAVPAGSTIQSVQLVLNMSMTVSNAQNVGLHRVNASWGEGASDAPGQEGGGASAMTNDATWTFRFFNTTSWTTAGGDFAPGASAVASVDQIGFYAWGSSAGMVADVQSWLDLPAQNFGWAIVGDESALSSAKRFDSRQNSVSANRPKLVVVYSPACVPPFNYCIGAPNSVGPGARIGRSGSTSIADNSFVLTATGCPPYSFGLFLFSPTQAQTPFGNGFLCLGGSLTRLFPPQQADAAGHVAHALDFTTPPGSTISAGSVLNFQLVYRNPAAGGAGFNASDGLNVTFCP